MPSRSVTAITYKKVGGRRLWLRLGSYTAVRSSDRSVTHRPTLDVWSGTEFKTKDPLRDLFFERREEV